MASVDNFDPSSDRPTAWSRSGALVDRSADREAEREKFRISRFDVVTSLFMALILFIGVFVAMLFIIWLTSRWTFPPRAVALSTVSPWRTTSCASASPRPHW